MNVNESCASSCSGTHPLVFCHVLGYVTHVVAIDPMKDIRIRVETYDGCCTIWYERSKLKNACDVISKRVTNQLMGLNIKEVNVSVI